MIDKREIEEIQKYFNTSFIHIAKNENGLNVEIVNEDEEPEQKIYLVLYQVPNDAWGWDGVLEGIYTDRTIAEQQYEKIKNSYEKRILELEIDENISINKHIDVDLFNFRQ